MFPKADVVVRPLFALSGNGPLRVDNTPRAGDEKARRGSRKIPQDEFERRLRELHGGKCPMCNGVGPVDVHRSHVAWSIALVPLWSSMTQVCCRSCGIKLQLGAVAFSALFGLWGIPFCWIIPDLLRSYDVRFTGIEDWARLFGLIFTPLGIVRTLNRTNFALQLLRNLRGLIVGIDAKIPSAALEEVIRSGMDSPRSPHASARRAPKPLGSGKSGTDGHRAASRVSVGPSSTRPQIIISVPIWRTAESQGTAAIMRNTMAAGNSWRRTCDL
jgi:hypothetical protein